MSKEQKTFALTSLTVFFLAFSNFLTTGKFIFTFPINDFILLFVSIYFYFINSEAKKWNSLLLILFSLFLFGSNYYNFEFFLNSIQLSILTDSLFTDISLIISHLIFLLLFLKFCIEFKNKFSWVFFCFSVVLLITIQFESILFLTLFTYFLFPLAIFFKDKNITNHYKSIYYFFLIVNVLTVTKYISIYF
jgi:hypothetical protein